MLSIRQAFVVFATILAVGCSTSTVPVDFATLKKTWTPNQVLVCPQDFCKVEAPDIVSPVYSVSAEVLEEKVGIALRGQPRTVQVGDDRARHQIVLVQRTEIVGFPDTIFVQFIPLADGRSTFALYSRSNYGIRDRGVNAARVDLWMKAIETAVAG